MSNTFPLFKTNKPLGDILADNRQNNFTIIRLLMSLAVLYNHSFVIFYGNGNQDITNYVFTYFDSGSLAVCVFFLISGMLLTQSYNESSSKIKFILKRIFRIFPALIVCILFTIFLVGPLSTDLSVKEYFLSRNTYRYLYNAFLNNEVFLFNIPSCFTKNKMPNVINGSLWTLPFELVCYIFLFLGLSCVKFYFSLKFSRNYKIFITLLAIYFGSYLLNGKYIFSRIEGLITGFNGHFDTTNNPIKLFIFFLSGMLLYRFRRIIKMSFVFFIALVAVLLISNIMHIKYLGMIMEFVIIVSGVLLFAGIKRLHKYNYKIDPSYGIYLYAWPVQQLFAYYFHLTAYESMLFTVPIVIIIGVLSFVYVERPALNYVSHVNKMIS